MNGQEHGRWNIIWKNMSSSTFKITDFYERVRDYNMLMSRATSMSLYTCRYNRNKEGKWYITLLLSNLLEIKSKMSDGNYARVWCDFSWKDLSDFHCKLHISMIETM